MRKEAVRPLGRSGLDFFGEHSSISITSGFAVYIYVIYLNDKNMMPKTIILFLTHTVVLCPNLPSRLEGFESQDHLASLIKEAGAALGQHRKELINLDPSHYTMEVVGAILAKAT